MIDRLVFKNLTWSMIYIKDNVFNMCIHVCFHAFLRLGYVNYGLRSASPPNPQGLKPPAGSKNEKIRVD